MPWRLIQFIFLFAIFLLFIVFNLENKCDINFGFTVLKDAPVYLTAFASFMIGMLCALPFIISFRSRRKGTVTKGKGLLAKIDSKKSKESGDAGISDKNQYGID